MVDLEGLADALNFLLQETRDLVDFYKRLSAISNSVFEPVSLHQRRGRSEERYNRTSLRMSKKIDLKFSQFLFLATRFHSLPSLPTSEFGWPFE